MLVVHQEPVAGDVEVVSDNSKIGPGDYTEIVGQPITQSGKLREAEDWIEEHHRVLHRYMLENVEPVFSDSSGRV